MQQLYPALAALGINNPNQINYYSFYQGSHETDVLRIKYARPKGSFLPVTRSYKFQRVAKLRNQGGATQQTVTIYEVSPQLAAAMNELDQIVKGQKSAKEIQQSLNHELDRIQHDFQADIDGLRQLIKKLDTSA